MAPKKKHVKSDCRNLEEQKSERAIKQILLAAEVNPDCYANFIRRGIDFQAFIEMTAEDLAVIGITKEAEINAILRCTQVLEGTYSKFMDSPAFDIYPHTKNSPLRLSPEIEVAIGSDNEFLSTFHGNFCPGNDEQLTHYVPGNHLV
uniref:Uncharacterized protein n=1 Tax=Rhodnius prolixus TaxID=13249 RepID=T1HQS4_RHOPR